jgi:hypothetical protein
MLRFALGVLVILAALPLHASSITSTSPGANEKAAARTAECDNGANVILSRADGEGSRNATAVAAEILRFASG